MATSQNINTPLRTADTVPSTTTLSADPTPTQAARVSKRETRILRELAAREIDPDSPEAHRYRDRFLGPGTEANVALAEVALLENRSWTLIHEAIFDLNDSVMYKRLVDQQYFSQNDDSMDSYVSHGTWSVLELHARLFLAGMIAERSARSRRKRQAKQAAHVKAVRTGVEELLDLEEELP